MRIIKNAKALVNPFAADEPETFPNEIEPHPGAVYFAGDVSVGGVMSLASSMDRLDPYPALAKLRQLLSDFLR